MLRRMVIGLLVAGWAGYGTPLYAEWMSLSQGLPEADVSFLAVSPKDPDILYAASSKRVYRYLGKEKDWKQVLSVRGSETQIHFLLSDSLSSNTLYVATDKGLQKSVDAGKKWTWIYRGIGEKARPVLFISEDPRERGTLWLGTGQGLVRVGKDGQNAAKIDSFPESAVYSVWIPETEGAFFLARTSEGIYKSLDAGVHWTKVLAQNEGPQDEAGTEALSQFQIEELHSGPVYSGLVHVPAQNKYLTASRAGVFESGPDASIWKKVSADLPAQDIRNLEASSDTFYAATSRGIFQWDTANGLFKDLSDGLPSEDVRTLYYHSLSGDLYAATRQGVYRFPKPELRLLDNAAGGRPELKDVLGRFDHEPTVLEVQQAAIRYAEVYPEKIEAWRKAAMKKAMLPTVSLTADQGVDHNVDIDRGGTGDADRFITGPSETNRDWHMGVSWDLGDLIWNDDQTSIDTRSKLMVELRGDILNEVTHLYFERRRLQMEMFLHPSKELPLQIETDLKLQELTADIDALTGGFLSARTGEGSYVKIG